MNRKNPDGRVDPPGANGNQGPTFHFLTSYIKPAQEPMIQKQVREGQMVGGAPVISQKTIAAAAGLTGQTVIYSSSLKADEQIVSDYSMQVIKMALKESGTKTAVITSTIRTPEEQAATMLKNAKASLKKQYELYGTEGDLVLKVYEKNKLKSDSEIEKLMVAKIEELGSKGKRVSKHCVSKDVYLEYNVIDIGLNSMKAANKSFDAKKFGAAMQKLKSEGYLEVFIDETMKSNSAWHFEIKVNKKALSKYEENTILNTVAYVNPC